MILTILNFHVAQMPSTKFGLKSDLGFGSRCGFKIFKMTTPMLTIKFRLNPTYGLGGDVIWRISRWPPWIHLGYWNGTIFAILHLCVAPMPPIKFRLHITYGFGRRCRSKNFKMAAKAAILDIWTERFSNSESLCRSDASHQVSAQSYLWLGRRCRLKNFKTAAEAAILDVGIERF